MYCNSMYSINEIVTRKAVHFAVIISILFDCCLQISKFEAQM